MAARDGNPDFHVLVIGAGSVGLLIAQRLKTLGISCTIYEREAYLNARPRDWNFGIYWAQAPLAECLPRDIQDAMTKAQVNPNRSPSANDSFSVLNAETGEALMRVPSPNVLRLNRKRFRNVVSPGVDVEFGKRLSDIEPSKMDDTVTAIFEDGTRATGNLLIGADGANSKVRNYLFGPDKAALQALPLMGSMALGALPAEISKKLRADMNGEMILSYHPLGLVAFISLHDVPDESRPETWEWMFSYTWRHDSKDDITDPVEIRRIWDKWSAQLCEPMRDAFSAAPEHSTLWCDRVGQWPTVAWDNRQGRVTLAGDAAHPMTYHRGQGLNNAVHDAAYMGRALNEICYDGKPLKNTIDAYDMEVVERGHDAVISSGQNSMMVVDWSQLKESPMFKYGIRPTEK